MVCLYFVWFCVDSCPFAIADNFSTSCWVSRDSYEWSTCICPNIKFSLIKNREKRLLECLCYSDCTAVSNKSLLSWGLWNNDTCLVCLGRLIGWANSPQNNHQSLKMLSSVSHSGFCESTKVNFVCKELQLCTDKTIDEAQR